MNLDVIKKTLLLDESQNIEYIVESSVNEVQKIGRVICAFLNSGGGYVVYGVGQDGEVKGVNIDTRRMTDLETALSGKITPTALFSFEKHEIDDKQILVIEVPAGKDTPYAYKNEIFIRASEQTIRANVETIRNMVTMRQIEPERWERRFSSAEIESDLSRDELSIAVKQISRSSVIKLRDKDDMMKILEDLSVAKYGRLTNAGDVLFAENPAVRYPQIRTKAVCFVSDKTDSTYSDMKSYEGPLVAVLEDVYGFIFRNIPIQARFSDNRLERSDEALYPPAAIREGLVNAFVHRDYSDFSGGISVLIYPNRLEIWNSGSLPNGITPETLGTGQISILRNPDIAHVLYLRRFMEKIGRGSVMIRKACQDRSLPEPKWRSDLTGVTLTFYAPEVTPEVTPKVTPEVTPKVTPEIDRLIRVVSGEMSRHEMQVRLDLKDAEHFRKSYLKPALSSELIEMTIPDKPNSSKQKYRLTDLGKKTQKALD